MTMHHNQRTLTLYGDLTIAECNDGTICENSSPCTPHPTKEGSYMCDCFKAHDSNNNQLIKFAGVYCEHPSTMSCESGSKTSAHAFCTNGGECKRTVGKTEEHAGCKCPGGYEGDYCQFVEGSKPSDWTLDNFMHPSLASVYGSEQGSSGMGAVLGIMIGAGVAFVLMTFVVIGVYVPSLKNKLHPNEKEMDTASADQNGSLGGRRSSVASPRNTAFLGGKSVYKKKTSTGHFVTPDTLEADGGVLTEALGDQGLEEIDVEDLDVDQKTSMEEVDLDEVGPGELA
mmetsp:Transcript_29784/g.54917  ORF Transcript_29784/g.54917 Transcript_29784/m.54917 type:complete len:285 (+) Transcript_29784:200-1054(+)|eukprot:CAMPEP_0201869878 /NCGR_PEP_ID=MMETSP0902-20130614/3224_1 /ASSEMBLY_ACC=CAM_ASM_000551 /TAXON_ID=420261 /ORGANISM="Thalassiosira antarctica, Strain CCMP982" /LENGTH=284 /DNA_ID=CAMNT_0048395437 /DNA_START=115 /DNA_END=969 /DNA_ORIENTATION=-